MKKWVAPAAIVLLGLNTLALDWKVKKMQEYTEAMSDLLVIIAKRIAMKDVAITAYSMNGMRMAASLKIPKVGTIAVSRDLFENGWVFGKKVHLAGLGIFTVNDLMHPRFLNRIDIFMESKANAKRFGIVKATAVLLN